MNFKKLFSLFIIIVASYNAYSQQSKSEIIDLARLEIKIINNFSIENDSIKKRNLIINKLFTPYQNFWNSYLGSESEFIKWYENNIFQYKNKKINVAKLSQKLKKIKYTISEITGYNPLGTWYIIYGPAWTDLGGLADGTMLIDLAHKNNFSIEQIAKFFPHELSHQIYFNQNKFNDTTALKSIIDEGLAVYINEIYWKNKYSLAENLGYSENELKECIENENLITEFFNINKFSTDKKIINKFRSRNFSILPKRLPGAIGYYIGYNIVKNYVKKNGKDSWKEIYKKSPLSVYKSSL